MKYSKTINRLFSLITCLLMMVAVAINRNGKIAGHDLAAPATGTETLKYLTGGRWVIATQELGKEIMGFGGNTPLEITINNGKVESVMPLPNAETPEFFNKVKESGLFSRWTGLTVEEALNTKVDAVSGATLSSNAVIRNVKAGLHYFAKSPQEQALATDSSLHVSPKLICTILVILMGSLLPFWVHFPHYREVQLLLNVIVLGLWSGSFISYSLLVNYLANGMNLYASLIPALLLIVAFLFPLFGKQSHYCTWLCPLGSLQELMGRSVKRKLKISPRTLAWLNRFHDGLWMVLMLLMWSGVCFEWMDYELFTAFLFRQASWIVIGMAIAFVLLSCVVMRPYCRFVCPTGCLLRNSQNIK